VVSGEVFLGGGGGVGWGGQPDCFQIVTCAWCKTEKYVWSRDGSRKLPSHFAIGVIRACLLILVKFVFLSYGRKV
jgi:hypothetical protein